MKIINTNRDMVYLKQPIIGWKKPKAKRDKHAKEPVHQDLIGWKRLLRLSSPCERIMLYGDAGMGKTELLRRIVQSWLDETSDVAHRFTFLFLLPMSMVRSYSLNTIICRDIGLLPQCESGLHKLLSQHSDRVLFLLDSYEDLHFDISDINKLIKRDLFPRSVVIVTSRPHSRLTELEQGVYPRFEALLQDLLEENVRKECSEMSTSMDTSLSHMNLLQKPINLALTTFMVSRRNSCEEQIQTQTELFNQIVQHNLLDYATKRKFGKFKPTADCPLKNEAAPCDVKSTLFIIGRTCFESVGHGRLKMDESSNSFMTASDFVNFGLFTDDPSTNSVQLPHPLFQDHLAAVYLAVDTKVRNKLLEEIAEKSKNKPSRLEDAVGPMQNVIKFLVGMSPEIAKQVSSLFVIKLQKRSQTPPYTHLQLQYELNMLEECGENTRPVLIDALVNAPVEIEVAHETRYEHHNGRQLLKHFSREENVMFLRTVYGLELTQENEICHVSNESNREDFCDWDRYCSDLACMFNCTILIDTLALRYCNVPVRMLSQNMRGVRSLDLDNITLETSTMAGDTDKDRDWGSLLEQVKLTDINELGALDKCDVLTSRKSVLELRRCGNDVALSLLQKLFPALSILKLCWTKPKYDTPLTTVKHLSLKNSGRMNFDLLLQWNQLEPLTIDKCTLLFGPPDGSVVKQNSMLGSLKLISCDDDLDLVSLLHSCRQLKSLSAINCKLLLNLNSAKKSLTLQEMKLTTSTFETTERHKLKLDDAMDCLRQLLPSTIIHMVSHICFVAVHTICPHCASNY